MFQDISNNQQKRYLINQPGKQIFFLQNINAEIEFVITVENADVYIFALYEGDKDEKFTLNLTQNHLAPSSRSQVLVKSVLRDRAQHRFVGTIRVQKQADNTSASLRSQTLLLGENALAQTTPIMEILPEKVDCQHAAVITPLDQSHIHYLSCHGLSPDKAKQLLVDGFLEDIYKQMDALKS